MNIGVITFHYALNQGAVLQAYALQTLLESWGHHVEFIDYRPHHTFCYKDFICKSPLLLVQKWRNQYFGAVYRNFNNEFNKVLHVGKYRYITDNELRKDPPIFDLYITGSDQVWNFLQRIDYQYVLDFVPNGKPKIAYAVSLGQCLIPVKLHEALKKALSSFRAISVREESGKDFISHLMAGSDIEIKQTLDPTLLIDRKYYESIMEPIKESKPYTTSYILSMLEDGHKHILKYISAKVGGDLINLRNPDTCSFVHFAKNKIVTPYQFLSYIKNAEFVVCSSFHAVVFSLIFHKPFLVLVPMALKNKGGNKRVNSLLEPLGLCDRCMYDFDSRHIDKLMNCKLNWEQIDLSIREKVIISHNFLKKYLYE